MTEQTQDTLFAKLQDDMAALLAKEAAAKEVLVQELAAAAEPHDKVFDADTVDAQAWARTQLEPHKKSMDDKVQAIMAQAQKRVDKAVKQFAAAQKTIEDEFYRRDDVILAKSKFDTAMVEHKAKFAAQEQQLSDETDAAAKALQEEYDRAARALEVLEVLEEHDNAED